jgi:hypothetical protein
MSRQALFFAAFVLACGDTPKSTDTGFDDAFADADDSGWKPDGIPDADADTDTDADADADGGPSTYLGWEVDGAVDYQSTLNGSTLCDALVGFAGPAYVGECDGCDFAFRVIGNIENAGDSTADCHLDPRLSFVADTTFDDFIISHADVRWVTNSTGLDYQIYNALSVGYSYYHPDYGNFDGPYWFTAHHDEAEFDSSFSRDGNEVAWTFHVENVSATNEGEAHVDTCGAELIDTSVAAAGGESVEQTIPCDGIQVDIWEVTTSSSDAFTITVDTVADAPSFDPFIIVNNSATGCVDTYADDGFACTNPPPTYECPAAEVTSGPATYEIIVGSLGDCSDEVVTYGLSIASEEEGLALVLIDDNAERFINFSWQSNVTDTSACATIYESAKPEDATVCTPVAADASIDLDEGSDDTGVEDTGVEDTGGL